jgi:hypothetical protein
MMFYLLAFSFCVFVSWSSFIISAFYISHLNSNRLTFPKIILQDGTYFCNHCSEVVGRRRGGENYIDAYFVEKTPPVEEDLPDNVVRLFSK